MTDANDPYASFEAIPEIIAFVHKQEGDEGVLALIAALAQPEQVNPFSREALRDVADALAELGFKGLASLIRKSARKAQPQASLGRHCPYQLEDGRHYTFWRKSRGLPVPAWAKERMRGVR